MKRYGLRILFLVIIVLGGYGINKEKRQKDTVTIADVLLVTPQSFETAVAAINPTKIPVYSAEGTVERTTKPTISSMPTNSAHDNFSRVASNCITISSEPPISYIRPLGILVLIGQSLKTQDSYLLNLATGKRTILPNQEKEYILDLTVSPNREWLGYVVANIAYKDDWLFVVKPDGQMEKQYDLALSTTTWKVKGHHQLEQWLDDHRLVIGYGNQIGPDSISLILDAFTGEWQSIYSNYPALFTILQTFSFWGDFNTTRAIYHPSLNLVLYPSYEGIVLWDMQAEKAIVTLNDSMLLIANQPVWSPDRQSFVVDLFSLRSDPKSYSDRNIFQIFTNGKIDQLTTFTGKYATDLMNFSWSPDGNSIAFWLAKSDPEKFRRSYELSVLNLSTRAVKNFCIPAFQSEDRYPRTVPIWSPDSRFIALTSTSDRNNDQSRVVIIDPINDYGFDVADGVTVSGWMKGP